MDAKTLKTLSILDFVELAVLADGAKDDVYGYERVADTIRGSRFRDLVERPHGPGPELPLYGIRDRNVGRFVVELRRLVDGLLGGPLSEHDPEQIVLTNFTISKWGVWRAANGRLTLSSENPSSADSKSKILDPVAQLVATLFEKFAGADLARFRRCARCKRAFYAARADSVCCSHRCNNNRLQHEWYQRHGKAAKYQPSQRRGRKG